jgi:hypothetical protein
VFVIDDGARQGTGFALAGIGYVTCHHVLTPESTAQWPSMPGARHPISVVRSSAAVDLAVCASAELGGQPLSRGQADNLEVGDELLLFGYPNYRLGDTGFTRFCRVAGFRPVSGVRRILVDSGIVGGMSGAPALDRYGRVVGICVTGAEELGEQDSTENNGLIPVEAIDLVAP